MTEQNIRIKYTNFVLKGQYTSKQYAYRKGYIYRKNNTKKRYVVIQLKSGYWGLYVSKTPL